MVDRVLDEALKIATENQLLKAMLRKMVGQDDLSPWGYESTGFALDVYSGIAHIPVCAQINADVSTTIPTSDISLVGEGK